MLAKYLDDFAGLMEIAGQHDMRMVAVKLPMLTQFRNRLPHEAAFDEGLTRVLADRPVPFCDFSAELAEPKFYFDTDHLNRSGLTELFQRRLKPLLTTSRCDVQRLTAIPASHGFSHF